MQRDYVKLQGTAVLRKLPESARKALRYYEVAAMFEKYTPRPPLVGPTLPGKHFFMFAVTDWSLFVLSLDSQVNGSVMLEMPFLGIRQMVSAFKVMYGLVERLRDRCRPPCRLRRFLHTRHIAPLALQESEEHDSAKFLTGTSRASKSTSVRLYPFVDFSKMPSPEQELRQQQQEQEEKERKRQAAAAKPSLMNRIFARKQRPASAPAQPPHGAVPVAEALVTAGLLPPPPSAQQYYHAEAAGPSSALQQNHYAAASAAATSTTSAPPSPPPPPAADVYDRFRRAAAGPASSSATAPANASQRLLSRNDSFRASVSQLAAQGVAQPVHLSPGPGAAPLHRPHHAAAAGADDFPLTVYSDHAGFYDDMDDASPGQAAWLAQHCLSLVTIEPHSLLGFHLNKAWLGAHCRLELHAAGLPGTPLWYAPPDSPFLLPLSSLRRPRAARVRSSNGRKGPGATAAGAPGAAAAEAYHKQGRLGRLDSFHLVSSYSVGGAPSPKQSSGGAAPRRVRIADNPATVLPSGGDASSSGRPRPQPLRLGGGSVDDLWQAAQMLPPPMRSSDTSLHAAALPSSSLDGLQDEVLQRRASLANFFGLER